MRSRKLVRAFLIIALAVGVGGSFLFLSTLTALAQFTFTHNLYPEVSYPKPDYHPRVEWHRQRPRDWVRLSQLPRATWNAVLANEDAAFFRHPGVDFEQTWLGIERALRRHELPRGVSTIHQQLAKNLYFGARSAITRKVQEAVVALCMDLVMSKERILENYLNIAEWGEGVVGIGKAAHVYFHKPASALSARESAVLVNLLPNPRVLGRALLKGRRQRVFARKVNRTLRRLPVTERATRRTRARAR